MFKTVSTYLGNQELTVPAVDFQNVSKYLALNTNARLKLYIKIYHAFEILTITTSTHVHAVGRIYLSQYVWVIVLRFCLGYNAYISAKTQLV